MNKATVLLVSAKGYLVLWHSRIPPTNLLSSLSSYRFEDLTTEELSLLERYEDNITISQQQQKQIDMSAKARIERLQVIIDEDPTPETST